LSDIIATVFSLPSQVTIAVLDLIICMVSHKVIPTHSLVFGSNVGKSRCDTDVEIASLVVTGVQEKDREAFLGELRGNGCSPWTGPDDDVIVGVAMVGALGSRCGTDQRGQDETQRARGNKFRSHGDFGVVRK
jgi:hypothetical protein